MDPVTHGLIGSAAAQSLAEKKKLRPVAFTGFTAALLADMDIFIHSANDPLLNIEIHRQFTHSFIFVPIGALIATLLLWWFVKKWLTLKEIYIYSLAGYATSGIADSLTSYGTQLLWPFSTERFAFNLISVFDPLFSLGILITAGLAVYKKQKVFALFALLWIGIYLTFCGIQQKRAETAAEDFLRRQSHQPTQRVLKPTLGNQLLWSLRYMTQDSVYAAGIRAGIFSEIRVYEGENEPLLHWRLEYQRFEGTTIYEDLQRFSELSEGFLIYHPSKENIIGDARYAMLPTSLDPLWGVEIDTTQPHKHLPFLNFRNADKEVRNKLIRMLRGKSLQ